MTSVDPRAPAASEFEIVNLQWGPIIAGAVGAAALGFVLNTSPCRSVSQSARRRRLGAMRHLRSCCSPDSTCC